MEDTGHYVVSTQNKLLVENAIFLIVLCNSFQSYNIMSIFYTFIYYIYVYLIKYFNTKTIENIKVSNSVITGQLVSYFLVSVG